MVDPPFDPYAVLQVHERASQSVIDVAYRRQARDLHPDAPNGDEIAFKRLEAAHDLLSTAIRRADLDRERRRAAEAGAPISVTAAATPVPFTDPAGPVATAPGASRSHGWWATWLRIEGRMTRLLATAPWGVSVVTAAVAGGATAQLGVGLAVLPRPVVLWHLGVVGLAAWLAATAGWLIHRRRSLAAWTWTIRGYGAALLAFLVLAVLHALAQLLGVLLLVSVVVLIVRHRAHRRTVGAPR